MPEKYLEQSSALAIEQKTLQVGTWTRSYTVVASREPRKSAPLFLLFHGSNQTGKQFRALSGNVFDELVVEHGCVTVYPDGYKGHWNDARLSTSFAARKAGIDDVGFTAALLDQLQTTYSIDPEKMYLIGYSNGGQMVIRLLHEWPFPIAGAMIISATQPDPANFSTNTKESSLPILLVHGTADPLVPYKGGMASLWGINPRGLGLSAQDTARYYAHRNHIDAQPTTTILENGSKNVPGVTVEDYHEAGKYPAKLVTIVGGGHTVPNPSKKAPFILGKTATSINSATLAWDFFQQG